MPASLDDILTNQKNGVAALNHLVAFINPAQLIFRGAATTSTTNLYSMPTNANRAIVSDIVVCNTSASSQTFSIYIVGVNQSASAANAIFYIASIAANTSFHWTGNQVIVPGGFVAASASATSVTFSITGAIST